MTTEEAIHVLECGGWWDILDPSGSDADLDLLHEALDVALAALRAQQNGGWISVKDRLPPDNKKILAWFSGSRKFNPQCQISWALKSEFGRIMYSDVFGEATHWQPLPKPPKGE